MSEGNMTTNPGNPQHPGSAKPLVRDIDFFNDISGVNNAGRTKAIVSLRWYEKNSDGSETEVREILPMQKPIVHIFKHPGYVNLHLDFGRRIDVDLNNTWNLIMDYYDPLNSVSYTEEELESGIFNNGDGTPDRLVYFPLLQVLISPIGRETEYLITGVNPVCAHVTPRDLSGEPCVIQMTFEEDWFVVNSEIEKVDIEEMKREIIAEIQAGEAKNFMTN